MSDTFICTYELNGVGSGKALSEALSDTSIINALMTPRHYLFSVACWSPLEWFSLPCSKSCFGFR